jgi:hypothetical protein
VQQLVILHDGTRSTNTGVDIVRVGVNYLSNFGSPRLATY